MPLLLISAALAAFTCSSASASNTFPGTTITGSNGSFTGTNVGATGETGEPVLFGGGSLNTMWYSWTAPASGVFIAGTCNPTGSTTTNFDPTMGAYTGTAVNALTTIIKNDDATGCSATVNANYGTQVSFTATAGATYRLQVDGYTSATGTFLLHYGLVGFVFATPDGSATEGADTGAFTVRLTTVPTANVTVTIGASAQCTFSATTLTFTQANWNTPQTVTATAINDAIVEGTHSCAPASITAAGGTFNTATGTPPTITVNDNDAATVSIANTTNGAEPATNGLMTLTQTAVSATNSIIAYSISGTAAAGSDYTALSGTVTIPAGATTATIPIPVINDAIVEGSETVAVTLTGVTSGLATLGATVLATNTIADNDSATVSIASTGNGAEPATSGVMTLTQTAVSATNTIIAYSIGGTATAGSDYTALSGTVTIPAGATTATISIPVINDAVIENSETIIVTLTSVTSGLATLGATVLATNTLTDDDIASFTISKAVNLPNLTTPATLAYTITVANNGNVPLTGLSMSDTLLQGASPRSLTSGPVYASGDSNANSVLDAAETWVYSATYAVTQGNIDNGAAFSNTATFDTAQTPPSASNAVTTTITQTPALSLQKSADTAGPLIAGQVINYTYLVTNTGNITVSGVAVSETAFNGSGLPAPNPVTGGATTLAPGGTVTFAASYTVTQTDIDLLQ